MPGAPYPLRQSGRFCAKAASKVVTRKPAGGQNPPEQSECKPSSLQPSQETVGKQGRGLFFISRPPHLAAETCKTKEEEGIIL